MNLTPPSEHQLLVFWVGLLVILAAARILGRLAQRVGQPAVIGELAAGLILGPSILGRIAPDAMNWLFPEDPAQTAMLFTVGWIGVLLLLVVTGFETDLGLISRLGRAATLVSTGSLVVPALAGLAVGWLIPIAFVGGNTERWIFALFIAAALSISSLPVIAKILSEMGMMRRDFGQLTLAAGMANDVVGWIALGFIAGLAQAGGIQLDKLAFTVGGVTLFFIAAFTIGQRGVDRALRSVRENGNDPLHGLTVVIMTALVFGVITQWLHVEAVLGAFIAGVILNRSRYADHDLIRPVETMTAAVFAPIFFATAGLRIDLGLLADGETIIWAGVVLVAASVSKFVGSIAGARMSGLATREGAALGVGLNARGALEIVIATVGLSLGVLNDRSYTVIVLMAMATSMAAPPMLRRVLANWDGSPTERKRLDAERQLAANRLITGGHVLIPTRGGVDSLLAAQVASLAWPERAEITFITAGDHPSPDIHAHRNVVHGHPVRSLEVSSDDPVDAILAEAALGYSAIVLGMSSSPETPTGGRTFGGFVDEIVRRSTVPVVVVRGPVSEGRALPWAFARALVPTKGGAVCRPAQELAAYIGAELGTHVHHLHVSRTNATMGERLGAKRHAAGARLLASADDLASRIGAETTSFVEHHSDAATQIIESADDLEVDLLVVSGTARQHGGELDLGHTLPRVIRDSTDRTLVAILLPPAHSTPDDHTPSTDSADAIG